MNSPICAIAVADRWKIVQRLSPAEYWVFLRIGDGLTIREISRLPGQTKSPKTIESQSGMIRRKLGIENMAKLRMFAAQFICMNGHPEIDRRVVERRLIWKAEKKPLTPFAG